MTSLSFAWHLRQDCCLGAPWLSHLFEPGRSHLCVSCRHILTGKNPADCCCLLQMANMSGRTGAAVNMTGLSMTQLTDALRNGSVFVSAQVSLRVFLNLVSNPPLLGHHPCPLPDSAAAKDAQRQQVAERQGPYLGTRPNLSSLSILVISLTADFPACNDAAMAPVSWSGRTALQALSGCVLAMHAACHRLRQRCPACCTCVCATAGHVF